MIFTKRFPYESSMGGWGKSGGPAGAPPITLKDYHEDLELYEDRGLHCGGGHTRFRGQTYILYNNDGSLDLELTADEFKYIDFFIELHDRLNKLIK